MNALQCFLMIANHRYSLSRKPFFEHFLGRRRGGDAYINTYKILGYLSLPSPLKSAHLGAEYSWILLKDKVRLPSEPELNQEHLPFSSKS